MPAEAVSQRMLLDYLREVGRQPLDEVALIVGISEATARRKLDGLAAQGSVRVFPGTPGVEGAREYEAVEQ